MSRLCACKSVRAAVHVQLCQRRHICCILTVRCIAYMPCCMVRCALHRHWNKYISIHCRHPMSECVAHGLMLQEVLDAVKMLDSAHPPAVNAAIDTASNNIGTATCAMPNSAHILWQSTQASMQSECTLSTGITTEAMIARMNPAFAQWCDAIHGSCTEQQQVR